MITPDQARERADAPSAATDAFERRVDAAINKACDDNRWPVCVHLSGDVPIADRVTAKYQRAGWVANIVRDERDGDYLKLERPWRT